jgi:hydroxyethylthiazole kinase-like uncharacterized protein yjeF
MKSLPTRLYRAEQVRALDHYTIHEVGISGTVLMERAGAAAFELLRQTWPNAASVGVVCGTGNNGGDGYVVARLAREAGMAVTLFQLGDINHVEGDALAASQRLNSVDITPVAFEPALLATCDVLVDGLLGTGIQGKVEGEKHGCILSMNASNKPVLSLDIPSGLNPDTGQAEGIAVRAAATISFIGLKRGLLTGDGAGYCGELHFNDLSVPIIVFDQQEAEVERIDYQQLKHILKPRLRNTHKAHYGHVFVIGGEHGYTGAVRMAGEAALRVGAGLVSIGTRKEHAAMLNTSRPELMVHGIDNDSEFNRLAERASIIAIGPGLGQSDWAKRLLGYAYDSGLPIVIDADALNLLSLMPRKRDNWVLTPHEGEAARMLGQSTHEVRADRFRTVAELQENYGGVAILKGAGTLICGPENKLYLCNEGNPGMASGGMGDVLTGIIAGLIAQGIGLTDAARLGVCLHGAAADANAQLAGMRGMLATDLMPGVRRLANP